MRCITALWAFLITLLTLFPVPAKAGSEYLDGASWQTAMGVSTASSSDWSTLVDGQSVDGTSFSGFSLQLVAGHSLLYSSSAGGINVNDNNVDYTRWSIMLDGAAYGAAIEVTSVRASLTAEGYLSGGLVDSLTLTLPASDTDTVFYGVVFSGLVDEMRITSSVTDDGLLLYTVVTDDDGDSDGYTESAGDCDDTDSGINPGAGETAYDGIDNDCDSSTLDDDLDEDGYNYADDCDDSDASVYVDQMWCEDADLDGYSSTTCVTDCHSPGDTWSNSNPTTDCDDTDSGVNPGAAEVAYDGSDNDCNSSTLDDDLDGDGYGHSSDCDDADATAYPGGTETCDEVDNDCDGTSDDGTSCYDDDLDGYTEDAGDCNDASAVVSPGEVEACNGRDDNCDGATDEGFDTNGNSIADCLETDLDEDGYIVDDCEPTDATAYPGATETCDEVDNDCDSVVDEETGCYDDDGDTWTELAGDCDDTDPLVNPAVAEHVYNGIDDDCDSSTLDDDLDQDGYAIADDCDDLDDGIYPGAEEVLDDGVDQDCDGSDATTPVDTGTPDDTGDDTGDSERLTVDDGAITLKSGCGCQVTRFNWDHSVASLIMILLLGAVVTRRRRE